MNLKVFPVEHLRKIHVYFPKRNILVVYTKKDLAYKNVKIKLLNIRDVFQKLLNKLLILKLLYFFNRSR